MMRHLLSFTFCFLLFSISGYSKKHALVIGISKYDKETGWSNLSSENDILLIQDVLTKQGIAEEDMIIVRDANKAEILEALQILTAKVSKGDFVFIHYSGHGQQVQDLTGDEFDKLDECIVPRDAPLHYSDKIKFNNHITDDELNVILDGVRKKLTAKGQLFLTMDSCHSGNATRGMGKARGTSVINAPEGGAADEQAAEGKENLYGLEASSTALAPIVCFFGSGSSQLNSEYTDVNSGKSYGSLSYALSKAMSSMGEQCSYQTLFNVVNIEMAEIAPRQSPVMEGDKEASVFGGKMELKPKFWNPSDFVDEQTIELPAGQLNAIYEGTEFYFYEKELADYSKVEPAAIGVVDESKYVKSIVRLTQGALIQDRFSSYIAVVNKQNFGSLAVNLRIDSDQPEFTKQFNEVLLQNPSIVINQTAFELTLLLRKGHGELITIDEQVISEFQYDDKLPLTGQRFIKGTIDEIKAFAQARYLRALHGGNYEYNAEVEIQIMKKGSIIETKNLKDNLDGELVEIAIGDSMRIQVRNLSKKKLYYTLIDISPENKIYFVYPQHPSSGRWNDSADEYFANPMAITQQVKDFKMESPSGKETLKLILSKEPIELREAFITRGAGSKSSNPFESLFQDTYKNGGDMATRGPSSQPAKLDDLYITDLIYWVVDQRVAEK